MVRSPPTPATKEASVPRYEYSEGASNKFWEIALDGSKFTTTYGRIGTEGKTMLKEFDSADKARKEHDKLVAAKTKKGYALVGGAKKATVKKATAKKATAKKTATREKAPPTSPSVSGGARYELVSGTSSKFWEVSLEGKRVSTTYGRIDTEGKTTLKELGSAAQARKEHDKLVAAKTRKGYALVGGGAGADGGATAARDPKLEAALLAEPDNLDAYLVYADWLQTQGDPRGELVTVQHGLEGKSGAAATKLKKAQTKLLKDHGAHFVPPKLAQMLAKPLPKEKWRKWRVDTSFCTIAWRCGFIHDATLACEMDEDPHRLEELVDELLAHPSALSLQELRIGSLGIADQFNYRKVVAALVEAGSPSLRSLDLADFPGEDCELSWSELGDVSKLYKAFPRLQRLRLRGGSMTLGKIAPPELRSFAVETGGLDSGCIKSICGAKWPRLESLKIYFGDDNYGAGGDVKSILPILSGKGLPALRHLGLMNADFTDAICKALPKTKVLPQLETLDLSLGTMSDAGAAALVAAKAQLKHLKRLNVDDNFLSKAGLQSLTALGIEVNGGKQREPDDDDDEDDRRYVSVGE
jgi:uncharacterized protein (TIGR02996 family)